MTTAVRRIFAMHLETATGNRIRARAVIPPALMYVLLLSTAAALLVVATA